MNLTNTMIKLGAIVLSLTVLQSCDEATGEDTAVTATEHVIPVKAVATEFKDVSEQLIATGVLKSRQRAILSFSQPGLLKHLPVKVGQYVDKDMLLGALDDEPFRNSVLQLKRKLESARISAIQAKKENTRGARLSERGLTSYQTAEQLELNSDRLDILVQELEIQLAEVERQLKETELRAPFSGFVTDLKAEYGEYIQPGNAVFSLQASESLELELFVVDRIAQAMSVGDRVEVALTNTKAVYQATIETVARSASLETGLYPIVLKISEHHTLWPGLSAEARFQVPLGPRLLVPINAVRDPSGENAHVLKVNANNRLVNVPVNPLSFIDDTVSVVADLNKGDLVVTSGHERLLAGDSVEVVK